MVFFVSHKILLFTHKPLDTYDKGYRAESYQNLINGLFENLEALDITRVSDFFNLFPLNRSDRLGGEIHYDAVDAFDLVGDAVGDMVQEGVGDLLDGGGHGVGGVHRADDCRPALIALAVAHADALEVGHGDEILPDLAGKAVLVELLSEDSVGFSQGVQAVSRYRAEAAYSESGTRERLAVYHAVRQTESLADNTDFIFEEQFYGLDKLHFHVLRQAADIVVSLYAVGFEDVGIYRSLCKELDALKLRRLFVKDLDELAADYLSLLFGVADSGEKIEEAVGSVDIDEVRVHLVSENLDDLLALALAHESVVDMDADQLLAYRADKQSRNYGRVNSAGQSQQYSLVADLLAYGSDLLFDELVRKLGGSDAFHGFGTYITAHSLFSL